MMSLNRQYRALLDPLINPGTPDPVSRVQNMRTGQWTTRHTCPQVITMCGTTLVPRWRRLSPHIPFADTLWQMMATRELAWLNKHAARIWQAYAQEGKLHKAYGVRWEWQLDIALRHLRNDISSRQVYVSTWDQRLDLVEEPQTPMPPCILGFHLIRPQLDQLNMTVMSRSCDVMLGLPHDLMNLSFVHQLLASELGCQPGQFSLMMSDLHLYDDHRIAAKSMLKDNWADAVRVTLPYSMTRHDISNSPDSLRDEWVEQMRETYQQHIALAPHHSLSVPR